MRQHTMLEREELTVAHCRPARIDGGGGREPSLMGRGELRVDGRVICSDALARLSQCLLELHYLR